MVDLRLADAFPFTRTALICAVVLAWVLSRIIHAFFTAYCGSLSRFPGPRLAALSRYWHTYVECIHRRSFYDILVQLHDRHGDVVRVGPNELHFATPQAYHDIYNNHARWDKEKRLYHSFGEDESSFGYLTYSEAKPRRDVLSRRFSARAVLEARALVQDKVDALCKILETSGAQERSVHVNYLFRCMTMDIITYLCFGKSVDAIHAPNFAAPIIVAMDASLPVMLRFKHSEMYKNMIQKCPANLAKILSPETAGLIELQQILGQQIKELSTEPHKLDLLPHDLTIYHLLMSKDAHKNGTVASAKSLYDEAQALMFAGSDTVGNALMVATFFLGKHTRLQRRLREELQSELPSLPSNAPDPAILEQLPFLNAVIKESLRYSQGVVSGLLRVVPHEGAVIAGVPVDGGTVVSCASPFVHLNADLFPDPFDFKPDRWLHDPSLDRWLVAFSRGPRSCLGINLAWLELRGTLSTVFRRFEVTLDASSPQALRFADGFLPAWTSGDVMAKFRPLSGA